MMKFLIIALFLTAAQASLAQKRYIDGIQKITFRTGAGTDNKIIRMLDTNSQVVVIEEGETWTKIKDSEGDEGYVLNRFLTKEIPYTLRFKWLKSSHNKIEEKNAELVEQINTLKSQLQTTQEQLTNTEAKLNEVQKNFDELKTGASDYIGLKKDFDQTLIELNSQTQKVKKLEATVNTYYIQWFLAGGGVLFIGWLIGLISRKKKYQSGIRL